MATISFNDVLREARSIPNFNGTEEYDLECFLDEGETIMAMVTDASQKLYLTKIVKSKIQGRAREELRKLINPTWSQVKTALISRFGVQEEYMELINQVNSIRYHENFLNVYNCLSQILVKMNRKYQLDANKPHQYSPDRNESFVLEKFKSCLSENQVILLETKNVIELESAVRLLKLCNKRHQGNSHNRASASSTKDKYVNFRNTNNSFNYRNIDNSRKNFEKKSFIKPSTQVSRNREEPMDVDVNFTIHASKISYR